MPTLKDILTKQALVPGNIEASLPAGAPKLSQVLTQVANSLPVNPSLPEVPLAPEGTPTLPGGVADIIKGIEDNLPVGAPKIGAGAAGLSRGGYRNVVVTPGLGAPTKGGVLGSGYRSI